MFRASDGRDVDYLSLQSLVETAGDHASGVGLDGDHRPQPVPEGPTHQETPAAALEARDSLTGNVIRCAQLPGANQSLQAGEARSHLEGQKQKKKRLRTLVLLLFLHFSSNLMCLWCKTDAPHSSVVLPTVIPSPSLLDQQRRLPDPQKVRSEERK